MLLGRRVLGLAVLLWRWSSILRLAVGLLAVRLAILLWRRRPLVVAVLRPAKRVSACDMWCGMGTICLLLGIASTAVPLVGVVIALARVSHAERCVRPSAGLKCSRQKATVSLMEQTNVFGQILLCVAVEQVLRRGRAGCRDVGEGGLVRANGGEGSAR